MMERYCDIEAVQSQPETPWDLRALVLCLLALLGLGIVTLPQVLPRPEAPVQAAENILTKEPPARYFPFFHRPLPVNQIDAATLDMIPGIGPRLAEEIIQRRETLGRIAGIEDLNKIRGLGGRQRDSLLQWLIFE